MERGRREGEGNREGEERGGRERGKREGEERGGGEQRGGGERGKREGEERGGRERGKREGEERGGGERGRREGEERGGGEGRGFVHNMTLDFLYVPFCFHYCHFMYTHHITKLYKTTTRNSRSELDSLLHLRACVPKEILHDPNFNLGQVMVKLSSGL